MADEESLKFRVRFIGIQKSVADKYKKLIGATAEEIAALSRQPTSKLTREYKLPVSLKRKVKPAIARFQLGALQLTEAEVRRAWEIANKKDDAILSAYLQTLQKHPGFFNHNLDALEAWLRRGHGDLSDNVWQVSDQLRQEMETQLALGIANGDSAATIARRMKRYLVTPDALFRRVRDKNGKLIQSRAMKAFHPGQGVYKSAYKNALRLTRTEMNRAYMLADHMRWQKLDFVIGIKISLSAQHPDYDYPEICEVCAGTYPKTFKFTGWHPQCLCHVTPVLADEKDLRAWLRGETKTIKGRQIRELPKNFKEFVKDNVRRFLGYKTLPYWIDDNATAILNIMGEKSLERAEK